MWLCFNDPCRHPFVPDFLPKSSGNTRLLMVTIDDFSACFHFGGLHFLLLWIALLICKSLTLGYLYFMTVFRSLFSQFLFEMFGNLWRLSFDMLWMLDIRQSYITLNFKEWCYRLLSKNKYYKDSPNMALKYILLVLSWTNLSMFGKLWFALGI